MKGSSAFVPRRYKEKDPVRFRNATGNNNLVAFKIGAGTFTNAAVTEELNLAPDRDDHGVIEPARTMSLDDYRSAVANTQSLWIPDDP